MIKSVIMRNLMPQGVFDLSLEAGDVMAERKYGVLKDRYPVRQHQIVACPALRKRHALIQTEQ